MRLTPVEHVVNGGSCEGPAKSFAVWDLTKKWLNFYGWVFDWRQVIWSTYH